MVKGVKAIQLPPSAERQKEPKLSTDKVLLLGLGLIGLGMLGFYSIPGMIKEDAEGSKLNNAFYCSVMTLTTVGFGDICPGETELVGRVFLTAMPILGLGFFCGPILDMASTWQDQVPGGALALGAVTLAMGVSLLTALEGLSYSEATHLCVITGTTIGYGNITPSSDLGRFTLAVYTIMVCNVMGGFLDMGRKLLESFCRQEEQPSQLETVGITATDKKEK